MKEADGEGTCAFMSFILHDSTCNCILQNYVSTSEQEISLYFNENANVIIFSNIELLPENLNKELTGFEFLSWSSWDVFNLNMLLLKHKQWVGAWMLEQLW